MVSTNVARWIVLLGVLVGLGPCAADSRLVELDASNGQVAVARYWQGDPQRPAVLILHGFLQTREFSTVRRLAESLAEDAYTVLAPTLTLGLMRRGQSLPCEAIHIHSMELDVGEVGLWVGWLADQTGKRPVLIGHSAGSTQILASLTRRPVPPASAAILISLTHFGQGSASHETPMDDERARAQINAGSSDLDVYSLDFCKRFVSTPESFLSYSRWTRQHTLDAVHGLETPVTVVVGSADRRMDAAWIHDLKAGGFELISIEGANHFFDQQQELDLLEAIDRVLAGLYQ